MSDVAAALRPELEEVLRVALQAGLADPVRRDLLLAWLPGGLSSRLAVKAVPADQLRADTEALLLHEVQFRQPALSVWLENAERLTDYLPGVAGTFAAFRRKLSQALLSQPGPQVAGQPVAGQPVAATPVAGPPPALRIQFISAVPKSTAAISSDSELARIRRKLASGLSRDRLQLSDIQTAVKVTEILELLWASQAGLLHFTGHGGKDGSLYLLSESGAHIDVPPAAFIQLVRDVNDERAPGDRIDLVLLNACHSEQIARQLVQHGVRFAIGTTDAVDDDAAVAFADGFYAGLANGRSVAAAFKAGKWQVSVLENPLKRNHADLFELACAPGVNASETFILPR